MLNMLLRSYIYLVLPLLLLLGCQHNLSSEHYSRTDLNNPMHTYYGKVESVRKVEVANKDRMVENNTGITVGSAAGALFADGITGSNGRFLPTAVGALIGATVGAVAENKLSTQVANEYVVRTEDNKLFTVVQEDDFKLKPGDEVTIQAYNHHRSRLQPRQI